MAGQSARTGLSSTLEDITNKVSRICNLGDNSNKLGHDDSQAQGKRLCRQRAVTADASVALPPSFAPPASCDAGGAAMRGMVFCDNPVAPWCAIDSEDVYTRMDFDDDPQQVAEYALQIVGALRTAEVKIDRQPNYLDRQEGINDRMRAILVDWLVEVHQKYKLRLVTLFLGVTLIDRYLARVAAPVPRRDLQLVGMACMLVAAKFEEETPPSIADLVYIAANTYHSQEVLDMEVSILTTLDFRVACPTPANFLDDFAVASRCGQVQRQLAQYVLELALTDIRWLCFAPSQLAASAVRLSHELDVGSQHQCDEFVAQRANYDEEALKECVDWLRGIIKAAPRSPLQAIRKKFSSPKHLSVGRVSF